MMVVGGGDDDAGCWLAAGWKAVKWQATSIESPEWRTLNGTLTHSHYSECEMMAMAAAAPTNTMESGSVKWRMGRYTGRVRL